MTPGFIPYRPKVVVIHLKAGLLRSDFDERDSAGLRGLFQPLFFCRDCQEQKQGADPLSRVWLNGHGTSGTHLTVGRPESQSQLRNLQERLRKYYRRAAQILHPRS